MIERHDFKNREDWLKARSRAGIGGSECAALVGLNPYLTNVELWELKTGRKQPADLSDNPAVVYGSKAEEYLRQLFALDFPEYQVWHEESCFFTNSKYPFAFASVDGLLYEVASGKKGVLEIKTAEPRTGAQWAKWQDRIPDNYYCQICWYMGVLDLDFAILKAQLKRADSTAITRHYYFSRSDVQDDITELFKAASEFWKYKREGKEPPLVLPSAI